MGGTKILGTGITLLVLGLALIGMNILQFSANPLFFMVGAGLSILGGVAMVSAFIGIAGNEYIPREGIRAGDQTAFSVGLLRCMIAISIADDVLDDGEVTEIQRIYKHLTGASISAQVITETANQMMEEKAEIAAELSTMVKTLDKASKDKLIIASLYILAADGDMDDRELCMLDDIRQGLKLSINHVEKLKKNFLEKRDLRAV